MRHLHLSLDRVVLVRCCLEQVRDDTAGMLLQLAPDTPAAIEARAVVRELGEILDFLPGPGVN